MNAKKTSAVGAGLVAVVATTVLLLTPESEPLPPMSFGLEWEHDGGWTSGFVVERSIELPVFVQVGFVDVETPFSINANDLTYRWTSTNEPASAAFYRVGAVPR